MTFKCATDKEQMSYYTSDFLMFVLVCFFLFGVELIDTIVEEPFGKDRDDLDLDRYCQTIRESVGMFLDAGRKEQP